MTGVLNTKPSEMCHYFALFLVCTYRPCASSSGSTFIFLSYQVVGEVLSSQMKEPQKTWFTSIVERIELTSRLASTLLGRVGDKHNDLKPTCLEPMNTLEETDAV